MIQTSEQENCCVVRIEGELNIYQALASKAPLIAALHHGQQTEINLSGVTEIDSAGLQLLLLVKREALKQGRPLRLVAHSEAVIEVLEMLGLASFFGDPLILEAGRSGS